MRTWLFQVSRPSLAVYPRRLTDETPGAPFLLGLVCGQRWTDGGKEESKKTVLERRASFPLAPPVWLQQAGSLCSFRQVVVSSSAGDS